MPPTTGTAPSRMAWALGGAAERARLGGSEDGSAGEESLSQLGERVR